VINILLITVRDYSKFPQKAVKRVFSVFTKIDFVYACIWPSIPVIPSIFAPHLNF
jgi:hypothetical protein